MPTKVLICDDSSFARKQMARCVPDGLNVEISFAENGKIAIDMIKQGKADVMFLDFNMPVMDGYETLKALQKKKLQSKVIVISGDIQPTAHERVKALGALEFIEKPVKPEQIHEVLVKHHFIGEEEQEDEIEADALAPDIRDCYQEITNIAMGQAGDHLARILNVFVKLPIPNVNLIEVSELHMMLQDIEDKDTVSGICQGFLGVGRENF